MVQMKRAMEIWPFFHHTTVQTSTNNQTKYLCEVLALVNMCPFVCVCQREGALGDDDSADMDGENGRGFEEYEWAGQKRIRATALLEGGFRGMCTQTRTLSHSS